MDNNLRLFMTSIGGEKLKGIRSLRIAAKLTQEQLAAILGVSYQAVGKWERGEAYPSASQLPALAEALHCTIDELYAGDKDSA